jgi:hypothetical protein
MSKVSPGESLVDELPERLKTNAVDRTVAVVSAGSGLLDLMGPGVGTFFGVLVNNVIPGQRQERIAEYIAALGRHCRNLQAMVLYHGERLDALERSMTQLAVGLTVDQIALFEDGAFASVRAVAKSRIDGIAETVARGIDDVVETGRSRILLSVFSQLSDDEVITLRSYSKTYGGDKDWVLKNLEIVRPVQLFNGSRASLGRDVIYEYIAMDEYRVAHLVSFGLLQVETKSVVKNLKQLVTQSGTRIPEEIEVSVKRETPHLTELGNMLLTHIAPAYIQAEGNAVPMEGS